MQRMTLHGKLHRRKAACFTGFLLTVCTALLGNTIRPQLTGFITPWGGTHSALVVGHTSPYSSVDHISPGQQHASIVYTFPTTCATVTFLGIVVLGIRTKKSEQRPSSKRANLISRSATPEEDTLMEMIADFPTTDPDDTEEVLAAYKKLGGAPSDAFAQLVGNWKEEWSSLSGISKKKMGMLRMMSLNVLPASLTMATFTSTYNRVMSSGSTGGVYEVVQGFTLPGFENTEAALVLSGQWDKGSSSGEWGRGAERLRCGFKFETARLVPRSSDPEASMEMINSKSLQEFLQPVSLSSKADYVDIEYISQDVRTHKSEAGVTYVLSRVPDLPFLMD